MIYVIFLTKTHQTKNPYYQTDRTSQRTGIREENLMNEKNKVILHKRK